MSQHEPVNFGKYVLLERIALGGMGELYRCKIVGDEGFEKTAALKKMLPHLADQEEVVKSFIDEAKLAALLQHPNIVQVYDFGVIDHTYFIAVEYLVGENLKAVVAESARKNLPLSLEDILRIGAQICAGLDYAHNLRLPDGQSTSIVHRDVNPRNVFLTYDGQVKIIDFGIAKAASRSTGTESGLLKGTLGYMSPEQADGRTIDHRSDIFSTGILLYEMLARKRMYQGDFFQILARMKNANFATPESISESLPRRVSAILNRALAKEPEKRYQSAGEMLLDLEDCSFEFGLRPSAHKLSAYLTELFPLDLRTSRLSRQELSEIGNGSELIADTLKSTPMRGKTLPIIHDAAAALAPGQGESAPPNLPIQKRSFLKVLGADNRITRILLVICAVTIFFMVPFLLPSYDLDTLEGGQTTMKEENNQIAELLRGARTSFERNRLTVPANDCAFYYYSKVLQLDPRNPVALQGCHTIANRYAQMAEEKFRNFAYDQARRYVESGLRVVPDHEVLLALSKEVNAPLSSRFVRSVKCLLGGT
jgi:serine/threonine protein kinase